MRNQVLEQVYIHSTKSNVFTLLGDLGTFQCNKIFQNCPSKILNFGIMEQSMVSTAAGLSSGGYFPVLYSITPFLVDRSYEQIKLDLIYNSNAALIVSAGASYDYAKLGPTHFCPHDISALMLINMPEISIPCTVDSALKCVDHSIQNNSLSYLRLSSSLLTDTDFVETHAPLLNVSIEGNKNQFPVFKNYKKTGIVSLLFTPDSKYLPEFNQLTAKSDVVFIEMIDDRLIKNLVKLCINYKNIHIFLPFIAGPIVEKIVSNKSHFQPGCLFTFHTIKHNYFDHSDTKECILSRSSYSFSV